jgi:integrase
MGRKKKEKPRFVVTEYINPRTGSASYRVSGITRTGERIRENKSDRREAEERRFELQSEFDNQPDPRVNRRTILTYEQLADAESAIQNLSPSQTLTSVLSRYRDIEKRLLVKQIDLDKAVTFALNHYKEEVQEISIYAAVEEFYQDKAQLSRETLSNYQKVTRTLLNDPNKRLSAFTVEDIRGILAPYKKPRTHRTYKNNLSVFFRWAMRRRYLLENPCDMIEGLKQKKSRIGILSIDEVKVLLQASVAYKDAVLTPSIAIALFAGLRPSELRALTAQDVTGEEILVSEGKMGDRLNRIVPIPPVLGKWLARYPYVGHPTGWRRKYRTLMDATKPKHDVPDILRHTSISFQFGRDRDLKVVAYNCGNSPEIIKSSYLDVLREKDDIPTFWSLTPSVLEEMKVEVDLPTERLVEWPTDSQLAKLVFEKPLARIAADLGVSDNAVRKRCMTRGIELPKNGYWQRIRAHR